ncbi:MAG: flagellar hook-associated protein FlgL [Clostridiales bacterium]|jgi:flagellar hook-associated protein 3 FlgL|nr:flagellar hook-associated protein FlgL [Clostridiales bacterium]
MRITNRMMTNNMLSNINKNKQNVSKLEEQYSTGKKIQRPSEDPIVTVRALKLRTNLTELEQYYEKNIPDAFSWMDVTESSLSTINELLREINTLCVQGSSDTLTATDRSSIVQKLVEMKNQIFQEGNTNYAGRYVFSGYKTDSSLTFMEDTNNLTYNITENFTGEQIQMVSRVSGSYELISYDEPGEDFSNPPQMENTYRIKLSYDKLENFDIGSIRYTKPVTGGESEEQPLFENIRIISAYDSDAYAVEEGWANFIYETGEIILSKSVYEELRTADNIELSYMKTTFNKGELKPEHYFNCVMTDVNKPEQPAITFTKEKQEIQYEVNFNQRLTINTEGSDAISHKIGRDIDDILNCVDDVLHTEGKIAEVKKRMEDMNLTEEQVSRYEKMLEQLETELDLKKEVMQNAFSRGITSSNKEQDRVNVALADLGSRQFRLRLTENRLSSQRVDFKELLSKNEDVDIVDTIINFYAAQMIYNSSLSASSRVVKNSLLDFL